MNIEIAPAGAAARIEQRMCLPSLVFETAK